MDAPTTPRDTRAAPFEGSPAAADFITRVQGFLRDELGPLAAEHGV
ncbi:MAG: acyl-CoA dehydrogenase, partial [Ideonella sp.]|nr:acyl-CoA dehydrogenase [Ideonella sp.]